MRVVKETYNWEEVMLDAAVESSHHFQFFLFIYLHLMHVTIAARKSITLSAFEPRELNLVCVEFRGSYAADFSGACIPSQALKCYKHFFLWLLENSDAKHEPYL